MTVATYCFDLGTQRTMLVGDGPSAFLAADDTSFLIYPITGDAGLYLYSPNRPTPTIAASFSGAYAGNAALSGRLTDRGIGLAGRTIHMQTSTDGYTWSEVGIPVTTDSGAWTAPVGPIAQRTYIRALYNGDFLAMPAHLSGGSAVIALMPQAKLGAPAPVSKLKTKGSQGVSGSIAPNQTGASPTGYVEAYRKSGKSWIGRKTFTAPVSGGAYKTYVHLGTKGTWRMRFVFRGSDINAAAKSGWKTVTVK